MSLNYKFSQGYPNEANQLDGISSLKLACFGGHKGMSFLLSCRIELTSQEQDLVAKYKAQNHPLTFISHNGQQFPSITVGSLIQGISEEVKDITILLTNEEVIKNACKGFKNLLDVMATFGGEEVVEFK